MSFEQLLETMGTLAKAQPATETTVEGSKKIQAAAADPENNDDQTNADNNGGDALAADGIDPSGKGKPLNKSFLLTMADGSEMEAFDGTEMLKSLTARLEASEGELAAEIQRGQVTEDKVLKSLQAAVGLIAAQTETLKTQETMIKSLNERVGVLSGMGRGVRSVRAATELSGVQLNTSLNTSLNKSLTGGQGDAMSNQQILAKSLGAMKAGRITGLDATRIETSINLGIPLSAELLSAISGN
jgi:hypothetical protein